MRLPTVLDRVEVRRLLADEAAQLVEVLPREEFEEEHLPEAVSLPLEQFNATSVGMLDRDRPVIVYCWDAL
jgi:rhodanese-related sulfurtransferase